MTLRWHGPEFVKQVEDGLAKNFARAGVYFTSKTRGCLNTAQKYKRYSDGTRYKGLDPSKPGEFPHKLSGQLVKSITWELSYRPLVLTCGSNLDGHPKYLQLGTRNMAPRPWLSLAFDKERDAIGKILLGK